MSVARTGGRGEGDAVAIHQRRAIVTYKPSRYHRGITAISPHSTRPVAFDLFAYHAEAVGRRISRPGILSRCAKPTRGPVIYRRTVVNLAQHCAMSGLCVPASGVSKHCQAEVRGDERLRAARVP